MEYFLSRIARSIREEFGSSLNRHCFVFPGRRAGLYFLKYLSEGLDSPVWAPGIYTINELFRSYSTLQPAGNELLLFELYSIYSKSGGNPEPFDDFYFWGDMLLNDFDDTDKYIVDAEKLFTNIKDLKDIDIRFGGLDEEQREIIRKFWVNFEPSRITREKTGFVNIWSVIFRLYSEFRTRLREKNIAYEGMIFRDVAMSDAGELIASTKWDMIHFAGFNALNSCEKKLMGMLRDAGRARFYWDYDNSYINPGNYNSAGLFMHENLRRFGNDMPSDWKYDTLISGNHPGASRTVIETSSDTAQVKLVSRLIRELPGNTQDGPHHTAVILADENLLIPVLSSLPEGDVNITMGYPLRQTHVYTLVSHLLGLQRTAMVSGGTVRFQASLVNSVMSHTLMEPLFSLTEKLIAGEVLANNRFWIDAGKFRQCPVLAEIFARQTDPASLSSWLRNILASVGRAGERERSSGLTNEFIYRIVLALNRIESLLSEGEIKFTTDTFIRMLEKMLRDQSVPFSGEPLSGIQIMGILETRALDFKNLIILSVNEGVLPAVSSSSSFIPLSLREAFGLPSLNHQESIFAYHFYRLLQRAENVVFTYNSNSEGLRSGEMSRFILQMNYSKELKPAFINVDFEIAPHNFPRETVEKTPEHIAILERHYCGPDQRLLSPSALNSWLGCRMKFFYRYVSGIKEPRVPSGDIDPATFGTILHSIMKNLYSEYEGKVISKQTLEGILENNSLLPDEIQNALNSELRGENGPVTGNELIAAEVLLTYIKRIIRHDVSIAPFTLLKLEEQLSIVLDVELGDRILKVKTGGYADRIDQVRGSVRIVDYKTGTIADSIGSVSELFEDDRKKDLDGWFQILLYAEALISSAKGARIIPSIYRIKKMTGKATPDNLQIKPDKTVAALDDYNQLRDEYIAGLKGTIANIFDPSEPFIMTKDVWNKCAWCPYRVLCSR